MDSQSIHPDQCLVHLVTVQAVPLTKLFEYLKDILHDVNLIFTPQGMSILTLDGSRVALVYLSLPAKNFEKYKCSNKLEIGTNMLSLWKMAKQAVGRDTITMYVTTAHSELLYLVIKNKDVMGDDNVNELKLRDIDSEEMSIPDVAFDSVITMPSAYFQKIMRAMVDIGEDVSISYFDKKLVMSCSGDSGKQTVTVRDGSQDGNTTMQAEDSVGFTAQFPLRFLVLFSKSQGLSDVMEMMMKDEFPLVLKYSVSSLGEIKFCLAHKHEEDSCHVVNCSLDYSRAITASAGLLNIYFLLLLLRLWLY